MTGVFPSAFSLEPAPTIAYTSDGQDAEAHSFLFTLLLAGKAGLTDLRWGHSLVFFLGAVEAPGFHPEGAVLGPHAGDLREDGLGR